MKKDTNNEKQLNKQVDNVKKAEQAYAYYSRVLSEPFDSIEELAEAEEAYYAKLKAKEDKAIQKKADANKVEEAFKTLNATRKSYKEDLNQLTVEYADALTDLKNAFEAGKTDLHNKLAKAEDDYAKALKDFTDKYPEGYHLTLKDGDFETTISGASKVSKESYTDKPFDFFDWFFSL